MLVSSNLDMQSVAKVVSLPAPTSASDAATKGYVDSAVVGLNWKDSVRAASTANVSVSSAPSSIDGITLVALDRVLLKNQTAGLENGIYIFNAAASALVRSADADTAANLEQATVSVEEGTNASTTWRQTVANATLETTALSFTSFGTAASAATTSSAGVVTLATQGQTDGTGTGDTVVTSATLAAYALKKMKQVTLFGDGASTQFDISHSYATRELEVQVRQTASPFGVVLCDISFPTTGTVRINVADVSLTTSTGGGSLTATILG